MLKIEKYNKDIRIKEIKDINDLKWYGLYYYGLKVFNYIIYLNTPIKKINHKYKFLKLICFEKI